ISDKKTKIYLWTGNCLPPPKAIELTEKLGIENINGGQSRFDRLYPSYSAVFPLYRQVKGKIQPYTSNINENIYTNGWKEPYFGFKHVIETFKQTEAPALINAKPRRISPINIYYHFFSGEKKESLSALKEVYDYSLTQALIPIFTSDYVKTVKGFISGKISKGDVGQWIIENYGSCRTIRLDTTLQYPDLKKSKGIIGFKQWNNYTYIHLSEQNYAELYLTTSKTKETYLEESSTIIYNWFSDDKTISFNTTGFDKGIYIIKNVDQKKQYLMTIKSKDDIILKEYKLEYDKNGNLEFNIPFNSLDTKDIKVIIDYV
ncbi:hypothetical protein KKC59_02630, partial [bacterium]|nr:hypothetical protein [bacterium]